MKGNKELIKIRSRHFSSNPITVIELLQNHKEVLCNNHIIDFSCKTLCCEILASIFFSDFYNDKICQRKTFSFVRKIL